VSDSRRLVYVSGAPGPGKTSLAGPLAAELGYALLSKDRITETLHDALGAPVPDLAWSRRLGGAAMELPWTLAMAEWDRPVGIGALITVDTTVAVDVDAVAAAVRNWHAPSGCPVQPGTTTGPSPSGPDRPRSPGYGSQTG
jgi:hypothetical protein